MQVLLHVFRPLLWETQRAERKGGQPRIRVSTVVRQHQAAHFAHILYSAYVRRVYPNFQLPVLKFILGGKFYGIWTASRIMTYRIVELKLSGMDLSIS